MDAAKVVLITGSSRGIGRQLALDWARNGLAVAVNYVANAAAAQEVVDQIGALGGEALLVRANVGIGAASAPKSPPWSPPSYSGSAVLTG